LALRIDSGSSRRSSPSCAMLTAVTLNVLARTIFSDGLSSDLDEFRLAMNAYFGSSILGQGMASAEDHGRRPACRC